MKKALVVLLAVAGIAAGVLAWRRRRVAPVAGGTAIPQTPASTLEPRSGTVQPVTTPDPSAAAAAPAEKSANEKPAAKKSAAKKPADEKSATKKPAAKKPAAKTSAAKKPVATTPPGAKGPAEPTA